MREFGQRDWDAIGRRMLEAAATRLAEGVRGRAGGEPSAIETSLHGDDMARVATRAPGLVARAQGAPGRPPETFMAPTAADLAEARAQMIRILQQDSA
jgi:hypothetical protein